MNRTLSNGLLAVMMTLLLCATFLNAQTATLPTGTHILFDKIYSENPARSQWVEGEITGYMPQQNYYKIRATNGINYTIANDPRWIRTVPAQNTTATSLPKDNATQSAASPTQPAPAGGYAPGTRVQFDHVEATLPEHARWDSGVVIGRDEFNRYQIRGTNGFTYAIQNDPRWIQPEGVPVRGRRHDYLNQMSPTDGSATTANSAPGTPDANAKTSAAKVTAMPPDGLYNVMNLGALHSLGELEIRGKTYRGLEAKGAFKPLGGTGAALEFTKGLAGLEEVRITGANYAGLNESGQPVIKIRYVSQSGFNEELEAVKEH